MSRVTILMYHALYADEAQYGAIDPADRPYAVSTERFAAQLQAIVARGLPVIDPASLGDDAVMARGGVVLSFDDGHASNYDLALPLLQAQGLRGVFFMTSDFMERRPGFCSWAQVRALADAGMTIGSHGRSHRFLADLPDAEATAELADSGRRIEDHIGRSVDQVSFPGGRFEPRQLDLWRPLGYRFFHTSRIGSLPARGATTHDCLPRLAVRRDTPVETVLAMARADAWWLARASAIGAAKQALRRVAGNSLYHRLYERLHPQARG